MTAVVKETGGLSVRNGEAASSCRRFDVNDSGGAVLLQRRECRSGGRANLGVCVCMRGLSREPKSRSQADFVDGSKKVILNWKHIRQSAKLARTFGHLKVGPSHHPGKLASPPLHEYRTTTWWRKTLSANQAPKGGRTMWTTIALTRCCAVKHLSTTGSSAPHR